MAIARDSSTTAASGSGTSLSRAITISGSDRILIVGVSTGSSTQTVTGVTYQGNAMTQINTQDLGGSAFRNTYLFYQVAPTLGTNNIVASISGSGFIWLYGMSYTGVDQANPLDGNTTVSTTNTTQTASITTTKDNTWLVGISQNASSDQVVSAGANTSATVNDTGWGAWFDTNSAQTPAGSHSCTTTIPLSGLYGMNMVALAPTPVANKGNFFLFT